MRTFKRGRAQGAGIRRGGGLWLGAVASVVLAAGCLTKDPPEARFYDQHVQPILNSFCVGNTSPCHAIVTDTNNPAFGTALGNLDLTSFESVQKRRDVLRTYGSYPHPLLLLKALPDEAVAIPYLGTWGAQRVPAPPRIQYPSEIRHAGGKAIEANSDAYFELKRWLDNGANRDGILPPEGPRTGSGTCSTALPPAGRQLPVDTSTAGYQAFVDQVQPLLISSCAYGTCHSSPQADFYLTCGTDDEQIKFNYGQAAGFVVPSGSAVEQSEILLRPLSTLAGGVSHTGGVFFSSRDDAQWKMIKDWAVQVQMSPPLGPVVKTAGQTFFEERVMPKLLQRGCALEGCHSPDGFNDFRLRSGANGSFAPLALRRNYEAALDEFMALDTIDVKQSRIVKKNIAAASGGIVHRAGPILEDAVPIDTPCPPFDPNVDPDDPLTRPENKRAFCLLKEWHRIERADRPAALSPMTSGSTVTLAFVSRPPSGATLLEFDTFAGGADLKLADATLDANGGVMSVGNIRSGLGPCSGLAAGTADIRGPEWSYDGQKVVFAGRPSATSGLDLWLLDVGAATCRQLTTDNGRMAGLVKVHNFDPVFAPDGSVVFASTRAGTLTLAKYLPNSNLYRVGPNLDFSNPEQMTFLLNAEIGPAFMQDGRVSMTTEKVAADPNPNAPNGVFYQLAGRRINWDLTDYHPLLAQRARSTDTFSTDLQPSVDYQQATEIREGLDRNFIIILSDDGALGGAGALATFNRSIGPFQADRTEVTFLRAVRIIDPAATGKAGTVGVYRSPFSLPNGEILASYDGAVTDPAAQTPRFALVAVNELSGARRVLASDGSLSYVEAALGYKRGEHLLFSNLPQLVFGGHMEDPGTPTAIMHFPDAPVLATLLGANLRRQRNVADMDRARALRVYEEIPPTSAGVAATRTVLGTASFESDRSLKVQLPARKPLILEFIDGSGSPVFTMTEAHQLTAGEYITPGPPRALFDSICGGCHGSLSGSELDVVVSPDALTGASISASRNVLPKSIP
jgi:WD40-like Beta Propeller Repeat